MIKNDMCGTVWGMITGYCNTQFIMCMEEPGKTTTNGSSILAWDSNPGFLEEC
jgi:hypothetical protein